METNIGINVPLENTRPLNFSTQNSKHGSSIKRKTDSEDCPKRKEKRKEKASSVSIKPNSKFIIFTIYAVKLWCQSLDFWHINLTIRGQGVNSPAGGSLKMDHDPRQQQYIARFGQESFLETEILDRSRSGLKSTKNKSKTQTKRVLIKTIWGENSGKMFKSKCSFTTRHPEPEISTEQGDWG